MNKLVELNTAECKEVNGGGILPVIFWVAFYVGYKRAETADSK